MSTAVIVLLGLSAGTYALKAAGPLLLGGRALPTAIEQVARRLPAALLASLVVVNALADERGIVLDARVAGIAAAAMALWLRATFVVVVVVAVATTAVVRLLV